VTNTNLDYLALRRFTDFITRAPAATIVGSADMLPLIQNGVTKSVLVGLIAGNPEAVTILTSGATYQALDSDVFIGVLKTVGAATAITLIATPAVSGRKFYVADLKGDADTHPITVLPGGGHTFDGGLASWVINAPYQMQGFEWFNAPAGYWKLI
jgi:hypothetical protein